MWVCESRLLPQSCLTFQDSRSRISRYLS